MDTQVMQVLTNQFYEWEYRGRGWFTSNEPIELEPPFERFFYHAHPSKVPDDGRRQGILNRIASLFKEKKKEQTQTKDAKPIEPFPFDEDEDLVVYRVYLPKEAHTQSGNVEALLILLSHARFPICFELLGSKERLSMQFVCRESDAAFVHSQLAAYLPDFSIVEAPENETAIFRFDTAPTAIIEFGLGQEWMRPIALWNQKMPDPYTAFLGIAHALRADEHIALQILFSGTVNPWNESMHRAVQDAQGDSFFLDAPEMPKLAILKDTSPLFAVCVRAIAQSISMSEVTSLIQKVATVLSEASRSPYNAIVPLMDAMDFDTRVEDVLYRESHRLGMLLSAKELFTLLHIPEGIHLTKHFTSNRKTKAAPQLVSGHHLLLGINEHQGLQTKVSLSTDARLKHTHIIGATGTGKSTLLIQMIEQDMIQGEGITVLDPHGDMSEEILKRVPQDRINDVIVIDPSDHEYSIGLNIFTSGTSLEKEVLTGDLVSIFQRLSTSWGDQMTAVLSNAILAILESTKGGTLIDLRRFLLEKSFRTTFLESVPDEHIKYYWEEEFPILKTNSIGPILTRLDSFLRPKLIRAMVSQEKSIDFQELIRKKKIMVVKLSQGLIGEENSYVLGTFIVSKLHQAALAQQGVPGTHRTNHYLYIDEFHHFLTPSLTAMISGVRKYGLGLIVAHQDLQQLQKNDQSLLSAILGNIYTRIMFRVGEPDAKKLAEGLAGFDATDLQNLGRGEAIVRVERPQYDFSLTTFPYTVLDDETVVAHAEMVRNISRKKYGTPVAELTKATKVQIKKEEPLVRPTENIPIEQPIAIEEEKQNPIVAEIISSDIQKPLVPTRNHTEHRYLQTLLKKMAQSYGYTATIEAPTKSGNGSIDLLLLKDAKTIAIEICVTTDTEWEIHNIQKCLGENVSEVISVCADAKRLAAIEKLFKSAPITTDTPVHFYLPDDFIQYISSSQNITDKAGASTIKGYRVNVQYDAVSDADTKMKRQAIAGLVANAIRRQRKKP